MRPFFPPNKWLVGESAGKGNLGFEISDLGDDSKALVII